LALGRITICSFLDQFLLLAQKQYHGGTNFDRSTGGPFIATSYDFDAPIDEYGMTLQPSH